MRAIYLLPVLLLAPTAAQAGSILQSTITGSVQLTVEGPAVQSTRLGSTYSSSGSNITPTASSTSGQIGGLDISSTTSGVPSATNTTYSVTTSGAAYSFSESYTEGDAIVTGQSAIDTNGRVDTPNIYGSSISNLGGTAGNLARSLSSAGLPSVTAGGAGTSATAQVSFELSVFQ